jgi:predicted RNA binding protein YcfA (HicA-like mRNA interferase family)
MRLPRNISGADLIARLAKFGYQVTRQRGSHVRLTTQESGEHQLTVPNHNALRVGTLSGILSAVAEHFGIPREEVVKRLFGDRP